MHNIQVRLVIYLLSTLIGLLLVSFIYLTEILSMFGLQLVHQGQIQSVETICVAEVEEKQFDLVSDNSITKFVNNEVSFNDMGYVPDNLVSIDSEFVFDTKGNGSLRSEANDALQLLANAFSDEFGKSLNVVSSYRSYEYQQGIKDGGCPDNLCAKAGFSEHQSGLSVDFFSASNQYTWLENDSLQSYYLWLKDNAHLYGFTNTYQKGLFVDGYEIEPWHWRYVGEELATYLLRNNITLAEYFNQKK